LDARGDRQRMGRSAGAAQIGADRAGGDAVRDHDRRQRDRDGGRPARGEAGAGRMSTAEIASGAGAVPDLRARRSWRAAKSAIMTGLMVAAVVIVALPLVAVLAAVFSRGLRVSLAGFPDFFVKEIPI